MISDSELIEKAYGWLKELLTFDTSNPPGNEGPAIDFAARILSEHGMECTILEKDDGRSNLFTKVDGSGEGAPLLLSSHIDVVPVEDESTWKVPPFSGREYDGMLWGRGSLDMKYKTAFDMALMASSKMSGIERGLKCVVLADEEVGSAHGSQFLTKEHGALIAASHVVNEVGGFTLPLFGKTFLPLQAGEKSFCHVRLHARGQSGHASMPGPGSSVSLLTRALGALHESFVGYQLTATSKRFLEEVRKDLPSEISGLFSGLLAFESFEGAINQVPDPILASQIKAMLCNTVCPTRLGGGFRINVIPEAVWADLDCRLMPSLSPDAFTSQLKYFFSEILGEESDSLVIEIVSFSQGYELTEEEALFTDIGSRLEKAWSLESPGAKAVPMLLPASSDNTFYFHAGITPIGFAPLIFPVDFPGFALAHAVNERIPKTAFTGGLKAYLDVMRPLLSKGA